MRLLSAKRMPLSTTAAAQPTIARAATECCDAPTHPTHARTRQRLVAEQYSMAQLRYLIPDAIQHGDEVGGAFQAGGQHQR